MADVVVRKCDECGSLEGVERYVLKSDQREAKIDLCETDRKPLEAFLDRFATKTPRASSKPRKTASATRKARVTSMEEIEALKKSS